MGTEPWRARRQLRCLSLGLMLALVGCAAGTSRKSSSIKATKSVESSALELSARNQSLLAVYSSEIEAAADKIMESSSGVTRRQALVWKAEAIPVLQRSLLNTDPLAASIDAWAFILQMRAYFEQPAMKQRLGEFQPIVGETLNKMEAQMEQLLQQAAPSADIAAVKQKVASWAEAHPIDASLSGRQSADVELIRRTEQSDLGAAASVKALAESIGDITARLDSYNTYLPKQARWQAELLLSDAAADPEMRTAMTNLETVSRALEKTSNSVEHMPELVGQTRAAVLADVEGQRLAIQTFIRQERLETLDALKHERIATVADMRKERLAATEDLRGERQIVLDALHAEEAVVMKDLDAARAKALDDFDSRSRGMIDHFFVRALELVLLTLVLCCLAAWFLLRRFGIRRRDYGRGLYDRAA